MKPRQRPRKSIRTILVFWLLIFSLVPLAAITGYSLVKYEQAIDQELSTRLLGNARQISVILNEFQNSLTDEARHVVTDRALMYYLGANNIEQTREMLKRWFKSSVVAQRVWVFNRDARLTIALYKDEHGQVQRQSNLESGVVELNEPLLKAIEGKDEILLFDIVAEATGDSRKPRATRMELSTFNKIKGANGRLIGYMQETIALDEAVLQNFRNRLNAEIFFFQPGRPNVVATHDDLGLYRSDIFSPHLKEDGFFELNIRATPYRLMLRELKWGDNSFVMGLGASKSAAKAVLKNVKLAFYSVVGTIVVLLIVLSFVASRLLLTPIYDVLNAIERADFDKGLLQVPTSNETELGLLADAFNDLSKRTFDSQKALKDKIQELEKANNEIRDTQAKLVHTAKMASLGQLVAGVAHELNNPIGFIYSNMTHLRDYSQKLIHLIDVAEHEPQKLDKEKDKADLPYIMKDLPKLISSCEDGARRTRDIVLGLRNFSRLEEAHVKEVDLHEGLENTLRLLTGELKNRIKVTRQFGKIPKINCYPSQLNQVFMNVLGNAAQAIDDEGEITIATKKLSGDRVEVCIRDNGKGMSKSTVEKIFDPFFTTKGLGSGTGLGLSISYGVIQKHGGEILVSSELGKGTEFKIILPVHGPVDVRKPSA
ncbi:MAG: two-component sensor histidine kinase [Bdellovibrionales bacterium]|nr:two-component sensor histidine kinase [Bdellovibrionales bacterium]